MHALPQAPQLPTSPAVFTHNVPQRVGVGELHRLEQLKLPGEPVQNGVLPEHTRPQVLQLLGDDRSASQPSSGSPLQFSKPGSHVKPQAKPSHVGVACAGDGHGVHAVGPHDVSLVSDTHVPLQRWKPVLHAKPHCVPLHVVIAFAWGGHGEHELPQVIGSTSDTQSPLHRWKPVLHITVHALPSQPAAPFTGVGHAVHDAPHAVGSVLVAH